MSNQPERHEDDVMFAFTTLFDMKQGLVYSNPKED
jgi:hypothetical protein